MTFLYYFYIIFMTCMFQNMGTGTNLLMSFYDLIFKIPTSLLSLVGAFLSSARSFSRCCCCCCCCCSSFSCLPPIDQRKFCRHAKFAPDTETLQLKKSLGGFIERHPNQIRDHLFFLGLRIMFGTCFLFFAFFLESLVADGS